MNFSQKLKLFLALNLLSIPLLLLSEFLTFFSMHFPNSPEFFITVTSIQFSLPLENSSSILLYSKFSKISRLCSSSSKSQFTVLCPYLSGLQFGGILYSLFLILTIFCIFFTTVSIFWTTPSNKPANLVFSSVLTPLLYSIGLCSYILISYSPSYELRSGFGWCVLIQVYLCLLAFFFHVSLKAEVFESFPLIDEQELRVEAKDTIQSGVVAPNRTGNETYQSEGDYLGRGTKRQSTYQSLQIEGGFIDSTANDLSAPSTSRLAEQKKNVEKPGFLKILAESSGSDVSVLKNLEAKASEIKNLNDLIAGLKEKLLEKDLMLSESERNAAVYKALSDSLSQSNSLLTRELYEKERVMDELRASGGFKSFSDVNENELKKETSSRYTESTKNFSVAAIERDSIYEKVNSLSRALEIQKEINEQLSEKNKKLERKNSIKDKESQSELKTLEKKIASLKLKKNSANTIIESQLKTLQTYQQEQETLLKELAQVKDKSLTFENMYLDSTTRLSRLRDEWQLEQEDLKYSKNLLQRELDSLHSRLKLQEQSLNHEIQILTSEIDRLKDQLQLSASEHQAARSELESLKELNSILSNERSSEPTDHFQLTSEKISQFLQPKFDKTITDLDKSFHSMMSEKEDLRRSLVEKDLTIQELSEMNQKLNQQLFMIKDSVSRPQSNRSDYTLGSMPSEGSSWTSGLSVQEMMIVESLGGVDYRTNPLLEKVSKLKKEPPMIYTNLWKLMEKLMQEKGKVDGIDLALKRKPRAMYEFVSDFFISHFGLQTLANRQLKAMVTSLEELHRLNHPYGVFFSRLLGLFHPRPIPPDLCTVLIQVQNLFNQISNSSSSQTFAQHYEVLQYGGNTSIVDVMEIVMKLCKNNRKVGERIIYSIHKDSDKKLEIALLKACGTMAKTNSSPLAVFELLDSNKSKGLDYHEFVDGIRYTLGIWISQDEAEDICAFVDKNANGMVTAEEWLEKVDFEEYRKKICEPSAYVTKVQVLNAFVEEYELEMVEDYNKLRQGVKNRSLDKEQFLEFVKGIDSLWKDNEALKMYEKLRMEENTNLVSAEGACLSVMKNKVGGYGVGEFIIESISEIS